MSDKEQLEMFEFEVLEVQDVSKEEFEAFDKASEGGGNFFDDPGSYELKIDEIRNLGPGVSDPSWIGLVLTLSSITGKSIKKWMAVPTSNLNYINKAGKSGKFMYQQYKQFLIALGIPEVTQENVLTFAPKLFSQNKIIGLSVQGILNYEGAYAKFNGKEGDNFTYVLVHNNEVVTDAETGKPITFASRDAVEAHCIELGIKDYQAFISLTGYGDCPNPAQIPSGKKETKPRAVGKTAKAKTVGQGW